MRSPTLSLLLSVALSAAAQQQQVKISDARILDDPEPVRKSRGAVALM